MADKRQYEKKSKLVAGDNLNWGQKFAEPVRPQKISDNTAMQEPWKPGLLPKGGYRSVFDFSNNSYSTKLSPTDKPETKNNKW